MENQVEKFDPAQLMEGVKDRIKATFSSLIPDSAWEQMIEKIRLDFFEKKRANYGNDLVDSPFEMLVKQEFTKAIKEKMEQCFSSPEWQNRWDAYGKPIVSQAIKDILVENSGAILFNMISSPMAMAIEQMKQGIQNMQYR